MTWQVVGHDWAVDLLHQGIATGRLAHAYLFSGPPQVGKTRLALALARALNCTGDDPPCGQCASCRKISQGTHPDVQVVVGAGAGESIKIEQIRSLQREAVLAPYEGRHRISILRHIDRASLEAANSLLKTLEEPPPHVVLILTAVVPEALPSTVLSRCQRLDLRPVAGTHIEAALREKDVPLAKARLLASLSGGRIGWALRAAQDESVLEQRREDLDHLVALLSSDRVDRLDFAWKASRDPLAARRRIELWTGWWRDLLLVCSRAEAQVLNVDRVDELRALSAQSTPRQAWSAVRTLQEAAAQLEAHVNARLAMEVALLKLPRWPAVAAD